LLLGTEEDWPGAFEALVSRLGPVAGRTLATERVFNEPFDLRATPRYSLVIDRLAWWYDLPREWLKKISLMDDVYLLNNPFTFQAMEKHSAYVAMMRLGLKVPETWMVPHKLPTPIPRFEYMKSKFADVASKYNAPFDLREIGERIGYPLYMKPFDGGAWVGVSKIRTSEDLHRAYDASGERLMHLQQSVEGYDVFTRSLSIGPETMVMKFRPELPMHERYAVEHDFLSADTGFEVVTISRLVNAFFRWEFNSCETLVRAGEVYPIDYANACPDVVLTSLHYYFPWAMAALLRWTAFCLMTGRRPRLDTDTARYFAIADDPDLSYADKLTRYRALVDEYFEADRYAEFCATRLRHVDELVYEWVCSPDFDALLVDTVRATYPAPEHDRFVAHFRGLLAAWVADQR